MRPLVTTIILTACLAGCATTAKVDTPTAPVVKATTAVKTADPTSLYARLGGKDAIKVVIDDFVANVAGDKRINQFFKDVNIDRLKGLLVDQVCQATGGPCTYTGRTMKETHASLHITEAHFNALVGDLAKALDKNKVKKTEKDELLSALGKMKGDIVTAKK